MQLGVEGAFLAASGYLGMLLLAWTLGPEDFGLYGVIITLLVWLERTTTFCISSAVTKLVAEDRGDGSTHIDAHQCGAHRGGRDRDLGSLLPPWLVSFKRPDRNSCFAWPRSTFHSRTGCTSCIEVWRWEGREVHRCFLVRTDPWVCQATLRSPGFSWQATPFPAP